MTKTIEYYFSLISPWSYLGNARLREIATQNEAVISFKPINVLDVFSQSGGLPLGKRAPQRQAYRLVELERWKKRLNVPLAFHPKFFPADEKIAAGMVIAAKDRGENVGPFVQAIMAAVWTEDKNISDPSTLEEIATNLGLDGNSLVAEAENAQTLDTWKAYTAEAIENQVFGVPTYLFEGIPYWGQDRLDFLEDALMAAGRS